MEVYGAKECNWLLWKSMTSMESDCDCRKSPVAMKVHGCYGNSLVAMNISGCYGKPKVAIEVTGCYYNPIVAIASQ
jgi:hypothetical protein